MSGFSFIGEPQQKNTLSFNQTHCQTGGRQRLLTAYVKDDGVLRHGHPILKTDFPGLQRPVKDDFFRFRAVLRQSLHLKPFGVHLGVFHKTDKPVNHA